MRSNNSKSTDNLKQTKAFDPNNRLKINWQDYNKL